MEPSHTTAHRIRPRLVGLVACVIALACGFGLKQGFEHDPQAPAFRVPGYTDIRKVYELRHLANGRLPYVNTRSDGQTSTDDGFSEYPVLTGLTAWLVARATSTQDAFFLTNAALLSIAALAITWLLVGAAGWRVLLLAAAPALATYAFHNWDLLAVLATAGALVSARRGRFTAAGVLLGLGTALKLYPLLFVPALALAGVRRDGHHTTWRKPLLGAAAALIVLAIINLPFVLANPGGWWATYAYQADRPPTLDTLGIWWALPELTRIGRPINVLSLLLTGVGCAALLVVAVRRTRDSFPLVQACGAMLCLMLVVSKIHSAQYALWVLPFFVLLRVPVWLWMVHAATELALYYAVFASGFRNDGVEIVTEVAVFTWTRALVLAVLCVVFLRSRDVVVNDPGTSGAGTRPRRAAPAAFGGVFVMVALACLAFSPTAVAAHGSPVKLPTHEAGTVLHDVRADRRAAMLIDGVEQRAGARMKASRSPSGRNIALDWSIGDRLALELYVRGSDHSIERAVQYDLGPRRWQALDLLTRWLPSLALSALVALVLLDLRRPWTLHSIDVLALAATGLALPLWRPLLTTNDLLPARELGPGALALTLPLAWFAVRGGAWWAGRARLPVAGAAEPVRGRWSTRAEAVMWMAAGVALLARWAGNLVSRTMFDISQAGFLGGQTLLEGALPYGDPRFVIEPGGDTYGLPAYVAYLPAAWAQRRFDTGWELGVAITTIAIDVLATALLALLVWRLVSRAAAARAVLVWALHPVVVASVLVNPNDGLVAVGAVGALLALRRPFVRGLLVGLAAWVKFAPAAAAAVLVRHAPARGDPLRFVTGFLLLAAACAASFAGYHDGARRFWHATFAFQLHREDDASVWGAYALRPALPFVQALAVVALAWLAITALRTRTPLQRCAGLACAMAVVQLPLQHLGLPYLLWLLPGLLPVLVANRELE